jgi:hypothetical protein
MSNDKSTISVSEQLHWLKKYYFFKKLLFIYFFNNILYFFKLVTPVLKKLFF